MIREPVGYKEKIGEFVISILGIAGLTAAMILAVIVRSWAATLAWAWFVIPRFGQAPLTIPEAYGLVLLLEIARPTLTPAGAGKTESTKKEKREILFTALFKSFLTPLTLLGIAWIVHHFFLPGK